MSEAAKQAPAPTVITLTLPTPEGGGIAPDRANATLLIQRGNWASVRQFHYAGMLDDIISAMHEGWRNLDLIESDPPELPAFPEPPKPEPRVQPTYTPRTATPSEPTISVPLKKGTLAVKQRHLIIEGREVGDANYQAALQQVSKLLDGKLWDGKSPIVIRDVPTLLKKMKHLTARDLSLFTLTDFVEIGVDAPAPAPAPEPEPDEPEADEDVESDEEAEADEDQDDVEVDVPEEYE